MLDAIAEYLLQDFILVPLDETKRAAKVEPAAAAATAAEDRLAGKTPEILSWTLRKAILSLEGLDLASVAKLLYRYHHPFFSR